MRLGELTVLRRADKSARHCGKSRTASTRSEENKRQNERVEVVKLTRCRGEVESGEDDGERELSVLTLSRVKLRTSTVSALKDTTTP